MVWLDFTRGGGGTAGGIDLSERGLPGMVVEAIRDGAGGRPATTDTAGGFAFPDLSGGGYTVRLAETNFTEPFRGLTWLGPNLVTPAVIGAYIWIWAGFAMVLISAGLAALPREALEAARVDGAGDWQVCGVTIPLLRPVLVVVLVTMTINVLKIFDLVYVLPPESSQDDANVVALEMYRVSFGGGLDYGLGSALAVLLFVLVLPAMLFNIRRLRRETMSGACADPGAVSSSPSPAPARTAPNHGSQRVVRFGRRFGGRAAVRARPSVLFWLVPHAGPGRGEPAQHGRQQRVRVVERVHRTEPAHPATTTRRCCGNERILGRCGTPC